MKYYLFIDESGDHGLKNIDKQFPVFVLCGVIISEDSYHVFNERVNKLKKELWGSTEVILHSRDIRLHQKEFQILFDLEKKRYFIEALNAIIAESEYTIISAGIKKQDYIFKYGPFGNVYSISLSFLIERSIFYLDDKPKPATLEVIVEKRGKVEDGELLRHYQTVHDKGTSYVKPERIKDYQTKLRFRSKKDNENGLQIADLVAHPIARYLIEPNRVNLAFDILKSKFYEKKGIRYGLKLFP